MANAAEQQLEILARQINYQFWEIVLLVGAFVASLTALMIATLTAVRQLRAYLDVSGFRKGTDDGPDYLEVVIKNYGSTPARDCTGWVASALGAPESFDRPKDCREIGNIDLGPGRELTVPIPLPQPELRLLKVVFGEDARTYIWGEVNYRDAFRRARMIRFRIADDGSNRFALCDYGNKST